MPHYSYLIVGGGMTADAAVRGIRELDHNSRIAVFAAEPDPPYARPPLTKGLWKGDAPESIWRNTIEMGIELHQGSRIVSLDLPNKKVRETNGKEFTFDKLLLASGGSPRKAQSFGERAIYFRTLADYHQVRALADKRSTFAVIGGGFIASEIAAALTMQECKVAMLFPDEGIGSRIFPADLARFIAQYYRDKGVDVRAGESVATVSDNGAQSLVQTAKGTTITADAVVAGIGIIPDTKLASDAGLTVDDGVIVDEHLRTSHPSVYAAGDVARYKVPVLATMLRFEHEDNAVTMGSAAGRAMAGELTPYTHLPFFYSDLFDLGYEAVGDMNPALETFADWKDPFREGVVYYLAGGRVRGVLLWNVWGMVDAARALIAEPGPLHPKDLKGRLRSH